MKRQETMLGEIGLGKIIFTRKNYHIDERSDLLEKNEVHKNKLSSIKDLIFSANVHDRVKRLGEQSAVFRQNPIRHNPTL